MDATQILAIGLVIALYVAAGALNVWADRNVVRAVNQGIKDIRETAKAYKENYNVDLEAPKDFRDYWTNYRNIDRRSPGKTLKA